MLEQAEQTYVVYLGEYLDKHGAYQSLSAQTSSQVQVELIIHTNGIFKLAPYPIPLKRIGAVPFLPTMSSDLMRLDGLTASLVCFPSS